MFACVVGAGAVLPHVRLMTACGCARRKDASCSVGVLMLPIPANLTCCGNARQTCAMIPSRRVVILLPIIPDHMRLTCLLNLVRRSPHLPRARI